MLLKLSSSILHEKRILIRHWLGKVLYQSNFCVTPFLCCSSFCSLFFLFFLVILPFFTLFSSFSILSPSSPSLLSPSFSPPSSPSLLSLSPSLSLLPPSSPSLLSLSPSLSLSLKGSHKVCPHINISTVIPCH